MDKTKLISLLIPPDCTIKHAMHKLNETAEKILFVIDKAAGKLVGTLTDGDIRRGLINGLKFTDHVEGIMWKQFFSISYKETNKKEKARTVMLRDKIEHIPILNKTGGIADIIVWADIFLEGEDKEKKRLFSNPVIIMAGGKGTRMAPFTRILPKPLIPIGEKPVIEIIMEKFYAYGFHNFIYTLNYKKEYIKAFLKEGNLPYKIKWVEEKDFMGTAGSIRLLKDRLKETFFVSNCDIILNADFADILEWHRKEKNIMTLLGCHKEIKIPYGVLEMEHGALRDFREKPNYDVIINTGVYAIEPEVISLIPKDKFMDMNVLIELAAKKGKVSVYPISEGWFDVGQWDEYNQSLKELDLL